MSDQFSQPEHRPDLRADCSALTCDHFQAKIKPKAGTTFINRRLESAWLNLRRFHGNRDDLLGDQYVEVLDLSKPTSQIPSPDWPQYIDSLAAVAMIGRRNQWLDLKANEQGFDVYWCLRKTALNGLKQN